MTITTEAVAIECFRPDLGEDRMPSPSNGNASATIPKVDVGNVLPAGHDLVKRYPSRFVVVPADLHPDVLREIVGLSRELQQLTARADQAPEGEARDKLRARAEDVRDTLAAHGVDV